MQQQNVQRSNEPAKRGKARKKSSNNTDAYYPQYLAERHFPSSQDPLQITVQVEIDGKKQDEQYPATLTIKHCFDNYFSYFLDLPRELRQRIRKAGEIKGWSQVDELTIKICLGSGSSDQDVGDQAARGLPSRQLSPSAFAAAAATGTAGASAAALGWSNPNNSGMPGTSLDRKSPATSPNSIPSHRSDVYNASALDPGLRLPFPNLNPQLAGSGNMMAAAANDIQQLLASQQFRGNDTAANALDRLLRPQLTAALNAKSHPKPPFPMSNYKSPSSYAPADLARNALLNPLAPPSTSSQQPLRLPTPRENAAAAAAALYDEQASKRLRYSEALPTSLPSDPLLNPLAMRSLTGGPALQLHAPGPSEDDTIDGVSWDRYMNTMLDTTDKLSSSSDLYFDPSSIARLPMAPGTAPPSILDPTRPSTASSSDLLRADSGTLAALRSPRLPDIPALQTSLPHPGLLDFTSQQLSPSTGLKEPTDGLGPLGPTSPAALLSSLQRVPSGTLGGLQRHNSFSPSPPPGQMCDVSTMVAELLHMVGYLKPEFAERLVLLVALQKSNVHELARLHAAMKGAWDKKSIADARQIFSQVMDAHRLSQSRTEGLTVPAAQVASVPFPVLMPGLQGAASLQEGLVDVLSFLQATSQLQREVMLIIQTAGDVEKQVINTGLVDACVRRNLEDLKGVVYSIINL